MRMLKKKPFFDLRAWVPGLLLGCLGITTLEAAPIVPGAERLAGTPIDTAAHRGELLLGELGCTACHAASGAVEERLSRKTAPDLSKVGSRVTPEYLKAFLTAPHEVKPGTLMPDVFHASEAAARDGAVDYLVHFLVSQGGPIEPAQTGGDVRLVNEGRELFHKVGCVACHAPEDKQGVTTPMVPLPDLATKTTVDQLVAFLMDPLKVRASGRMPHLWLTRPEAEAISIYLLRDQLKTSIQAESTSTVAGVAWEYFEANMGRTMPDFDQLTATDKGNADGFSLSLPRKHRGDQFALRFRATLKVPRNGRYEFFTRSDDGSRLLINGEVIVDNDGIHPMNEKSGALQLRKGDYDIEVQYFELSGQEGLDVLWSGPGVRKQRIPKDVLRGRDSRLSMQPETQPFQVDAEKVQFGARMFSMLRCVNCHQLEGIQPFRPALDLASIQVENAEGCLGNSVKRGLPQFGLSDGQRADLKAALARRSDLAQVRPASEQVLHKMASLNCFACHNRAGAGGPDEARQKYFETTFEIDLGEEGKLPPSLNHAGFKFKPEALQALLVEGKHHVRHYMATRMPGFGEANLKGLVEALGQADQPAQSAPMPEFSEASAKVGHHLVGANALACITCHQLNGNKAIGIQGIDLSTAFERLNPAWFQGFLLNPLAFKAETRMPSFWPEGQSLLPNVLGGSTTAQIQAIWNYLSLGSSMPIPAGVQVEGQVGRELIPAEEPIVHRTFMEGVGPRSILTGYPEKLNLAFDANVVRLAKLWRGRFFDASGVASGRTQDFNDPLGGDVFDLPAGPTFAVLEKADSPWPQPEQGARNIGGRFRGYRLDGDRRPTFLYELAGISVEERPVPVIRPGGAAVNRVFHLRSTQPVQGAYFLAAAGNRIELSGEGSYKIDGKWTVSLKLGNGLKPVIRSSGGRKEVVVLLPNRPLDLTLEQNLVW